MGRDRDPSTTQPHRIHIHTRVAVAFALAVAVACAAQAQTVNLVPACGKPGDPFHIGGRGWPEPPPPCTYTFFFDGADFGVPPQPDGLFGPPDQSATVPAGATEGKKPVRIDLRLNDDNSLQGSASADFCVVADTTGMLTGAPSGTNGIDVTYKPSCKNKCTKIMFIQTLNEIGTKDDDTTALALPSTWGFPAAQDNDYGVTPAMDAVRVDRLHGRTQPYYGGDGAGLGNQTMGKSDGCNITDATMHDAPSQSDDSYPAGFKKLTLNFTSHVFCVAGEDAGKFYGSIGWVWMKSKGGMEMVTIGMGTPTGDPSATARGAMDRWATNHGFMIPSPAP